jgi:hypothetical protein
MTGFFLPLAGFCRKRSMANNQPVDEMKNPLSQSDRGFLHQATKLVGYNQRVD